METEVRRQAEYESLRATIRERGTARLVLVPLIFIGWAATVIATSAVITVALSTLVPLMVLAAGMEAIFALHTNVERIGRYLQVFHERSGAVGSEPDDIGSVVEENGNTGYAGGWEHVAMELGRRFPGGGPDPLFSRLFAFAVSINFLPAALGGTEVELAVLAVVHLLVINRVRVCRAAAARQREADLERFMAVRSAAPNG